MNHELIGYVRRSEDAERSGDAHAALEWHRSVPMYRRNRHVGLMEQLVHIGEDALPEWAWARWITYQAIRCGTGDTGAIGRALLQVVVHTVHEDLLRECFEREGDPIKVAAAVLGESWVFHQLAAHGSDMVASFLDEQARGRLAEHTDLVRRWTNARMSGYRLLESLPGSRLAVQEVGTDEVTEVLDLGARSVAADGWVLGRLVPSGVGELAMFDLTPLPVDETVARSAAMAEGWLRPLADQCRAGELTSQDLLREDYELVTDVQCLDLVRFGTRPAELARTMDSLRGGRDEVCRAAFRILGQAVAGDLTAEDQAYVAAAALNPRVQDDLRRTLLRPGHPEPWVAWAGRTPNPARAHLLALAEAARASA
jgi:hypothetical protein